MARLLNAAAAIVAVFLFSGTVAHASDVQVSSLRGPATVERGGETLNVYRGTELAEQDVIQTGNEAILDVSWGRSWACRLLANTEMKVSNSDPENIILELERGEMLVRVKKLPSASTFRVETPTAVAVVRGTEFLQRYDPATGVSIVSVRSGKIEFSKALGEPGVFVGFDQSAEVGKDGVVSARPATPEEKGVLRQVSKIELAKGNERW